MRTRHDDLVYDVGMNNGADTAYYLHQGYRVLAIDADPAMIGMAQKQFAREIGEGRLTLLNIGISAEPGKATFWICDDKPEWNSFDRARASREERPHHAIEIPTLPFREVLDTYGVPHFLKIDIEGDEHLCLGDLGEGPLPTFLSTEAEQNPPEVSLGLLERAGYRRFKLIRQTDWWAARKGAADTIQRLLCSAAYGRLRPLRLGSLTRKFTDRHSLESLGYSFTGGSSGPWGVDTPGPWQNAFNARSTLKAEWERVKRSGIAQTRVWWDWHATL